MNASRSEILRRVAYLAASVALIASQNLVAWFASKPTRTSVRSISNSGLPR